VPKTKLNILFLASWYPSKVHSTLGNFVEKHARSVSTLHNVTVIYITRDAHLSTVYQIDQNHSSNFTEIICYYKDRGFIGSGYIKAFNHLIKTIFQNNLSAFDLCHVNVLYRAGLLALQCKKKHQLPYVITEHWTGYHVNEGRDIPFIQRFLSKKIAKDAAYILPVSDHLGKAMKNYGLDAKYEVIPNVVDFKDFSPSEEKPEVFTFIHVSSLKDEHKNTSGIINTFSLLLKSHNAKLHIIGDGDTEPYLKQADKLGLQPTNFKIEGEKTSLEVSQAMKKAHCFILFSNYENQPCVIPEAYGAGIPVIATDVGGIKEHLSTEQGVLIEKQNTDELLKAMKQVMDDYNYSPTGLNTYAQEHFSVKTIALRFTEVYEKTLAK